MFVSSRYVVACCSATNRLLPSNSLHAINNEAIRSYCDNLISGILQEIWLPSNACDIYKIQCDNVGEIKLLADGTESLVWLYTLIPPPIPFTDFLLF